MRQQRFAAIRRSDSHRAIASNLVALIGHVQVGTKLIEAAIAMESARGNQDTNIIVLDDVTPRYAKANAALNACNAGLGVALHFLLDKTQGQQRTRPANPAANRFVRSAAI
jgi:hypothetical protein